MMRVKALIVDEVHCVKRWGDTFRPEYANISNIRGFFAGVPVAGLTATLTPAAFEELLHIFHMKQDYTLQLRQTSNRSNLFYGVSTISKGQAETFSDLSFLIPEGMSQDLTDEEIKFAIPFTIIYGNLKHTIDRIAFTLQERLPWKWRQRPTGTYGTHDDLRSKAARVVAIYHASISDLLKAYTNADVANDTCRILCASSAYGLVVDNRKVHRVMQWRVTNLDSIEELIQR